MESPRCECGRPWTDCVWTMQRTQQTRISYYRCQTCSREWIVVEGAQDLSYQVSLEEIAEVHRQMARSDITLAELQS